MICPSCGRENEADARFCSGCGTLLTAPEPARRERKVVTVLFADLVGSTATAERLDPEEVDARLRSYHARVREELERYGGTVEKFIGDAVVALFGAPLAHEDDPERAVRAALAIRDWAREEQELQVRVAVNTGEALVTLGARPSDGEGMAAGDVINTAARLQGAAPVNGVLVGEGTFRATDRVIDYAERKPVEAKGKAEPVPVWEALEARSRLGVDVSQESRATLVGRERERELLLSALERVRVEREPQLVTLIGVPGIGKSRLVYELLQAVQEDPDLIYWRQGRSLPYGEGVAFWAFAEMVKAQAGILETDSAEAARAKLGEMARDLCPADADWVETALGPLVGLGDGAETSRDESFAAWRTFVETMADRHPTVLVFEDLHWADEGLLDFVDHLVDYATGMPLLCVCTARPELLERRPGWGGGKLNSNTIALPALSEDQTQRLLANLVGQAVVPAELLQLAGGNPLYAEEYARMLADRGLEAALPETVQGIIAARLDVLSAEEKAAIQSASVFGKVFWSGALASLDGGAAGSVERCLHALTRKEFVRRERRSSVGDEDEYAFRHVLVRDVAYGQIPRAERADKHRRAAEWLESLGRADDQAESIAHHYASALEAARASGSEAAQELEPRARDALKRAGERAYSLNAFATAADFYSRALELTSDDDAARPRLLLERARAFTLGERSGDELLIEACDACLAVGDVEGAADALGRLGRLEAYRGNLDASLANHHRAYELLSTEPPSPPKAFVTSMLGGGYWLRGRPDEARPFFEEALALGDALDDDSVRLYALGRLAWLEMQTDRDEGLRKLDTALELARTHRGRDLALTTYGLAADTSAKFGRLDEAFALRAEGLAAARRVHSVDNIEFFERERVAELWHRGEWQAAVAAVEELLQRPAHFLNGFLRTLRALIRVARDDLDDAHADAAFAIEDARTQGQPQLLDPALATFALVEAARGNTQAATATVREAISLLGGLLSESTIVLVDAAIELGLQGDAVGALEPTIDTSWRTAAIAYARAEFVDAADVLEQIGSRPDEARARLCAADALSRAGRPAEAQDQLQRALAFYRSVGATRYLREGEALLAKSA